jgi:hypothetical protein
VEREPNLSTDFWKHLYAESRHRVGSGSMEIKLTADLIADGWSIDEVLRLSRSGALERIRRGAYDQAPADDLDPRERHRRLIAATVMQTSTDGVVSHMSAAVLHRLPTWRRQLARVHLTRDQPGGGKIRRYVHLHVAPLPEDEVAMVGDHRVTAIPRTVLDLLRTLPMEHGVPIGDAALRGGLRPEDLAEVALRCHGWPGMRSARRSAAFLDRRSESVGESYSRVVMVRAGIPRPTPQYEVWDGHVLVGRADFGWEELRTLGEFDGKVKYAELLQPGQTASDVVYQEKCREDALRDLGWQVVRWTWADLRDPAALRARLDRAFQRGRRS